MGSCDQVSLREAMESFKVSVCVLAVVGLCQSAPQVNTNQVVQTVTTQLQPLISDAVARALASISISSSSSSSGFASGSRSGSSFGATSGAAVARGLSEEEELEYNRKLSANAAYDYGYKVANDEKQTYMAHEESRNGQDVQGKYNYVDANGDLVTVTYTVSAPVRTVSSSSSSTPQLFAGDNSVRISTPEFNIEY